VLVGSFIGPDRLDCHEQQRVFRAGRYASAATVAILLLNFGYRHVTDAWEKSDRLPIADIATGLANDAFFCKALVRHLQIQLPERLSVSAQDRFGAIINALTAKSAFAASEIDFGVSGCTVYDDAFRAGIDAFTTGRTAFDELQFVSRTGRTYRRRGRYGYSAEQVASADVNLAGSVRGHHRHRSNSSFISPRFEQDLSGQWGILKRPDRAIN